MVFIVLQRQNRSEPASIVLNLEDTGFWRVKIVTQESEGFLNTVEAKGLGYAGVITQRCS